MNQSSSKQSSASYPYVPEGYKASSQVSDEIDVRELFQALWQGKLTILACLVVFIAGAVLHAITAQEWWLSTARIALPQTQDYSQYQMQVKQFQPIFDVYQDDGTVLVSTELDDLVDQQTLLNEFMLTFNSNINKRSFLESNAIFQEYKSKLALAEKAESTIADDESIRRLYNDWYKRLSSGVAEQNSEDIYDLSVQATSKQDSYNMLNDYIRFTSDRVRQSLLRNLQALMSSKKNELLQQRSALTLQAKQKLSVEIQRAEYALEIAKAAKVNQPIQNLGDGEIFAINIGSEAIEAKVAALKSVDNLSVLEPRIQQIESKLTLLNNTQVNRNVDFETFRYLEAPEAPLNRDAPKRTLIVVLGALLGGMLGVAICLVRFIVGRSLNEPSSK